MSDKFQGLVIVIPTRNRADLATNCVNSVLNQVATENVRVIVSDNSTEENHLRDLKAFCDNTVHPQLSYTRPPEPLSMTAHWEWIREQIEKNATESHVSYITDRNILRGGELKTLVALAEKFPSKVVTHNQDTIDDASLPVKLTQLPWTGKVFRVKSEFILDLSAVSVWHYAIPRMSNCTVPKSVFDRIVKKYGSVFESISPDFCFAYKCLDVEEDFIYLDKPLQTNYCVKRSNGLSMGKGIMQKEFTDFLGNLGKNNVVLNHATPVPEFQTVINAIIHEYCFIKEKAHSSKFKELEVNAYLEANEIEIAYVENESLKNAMIKLLEDKKREISETSVDKKTAVFKRHTAGKILTKFLMSFAGLTESNFSSMMNGKISEFGDLYEALNASQNTPIPNRLGYSLLEYRIDKKLPELK